MQFHMITLGRQVFIDRFRATAIWQEEKIHILLSISTYMFVDRLGLFYFSPSLPPP